MRCKLFASLAITLLFVFSQTIAQDKVLKRDTSEISTSLPEVVVTTFDLTKVLKEQPTVASLISKNVLDSFDGRYFNIAPAINFYSSIRMKFDF